MFATLTDAWLQRRSLTLQQGTGHQINPVRAEQVFPPNRGSLVRCIAAVQPHPCVFDARPQGAVYGTASLRSVCLAGRLPDSLSRCLAIHSPPQAHLAHLCSKHETSGQVQVEVLGAQTTTVVQLQRFLAVKLVRSPFDTILFAPNGFSCY